MKQMRRTTTAPITTTNHFSPGTTSQLSLSRKNDDQDPDNKNNNNQPPQTSTTDRFLSPKIDDLGLPLTDALLAQIVAPTLQVFALSITHAPLPAWLVPSPTTVGLLYAPAAQGTYLAPSLIHGAGLAVCWIAGALAARGFESEAFDVSGNKGYGEVVKRIVQAGSFASGILIFSTQLDLLLEFGRWVQLGESDAIDFRLVRASVEVLNDIVFEAGVVGSWRLYRASLTAGRDSW